MRRIGVRSSGAIDAGWCHRLQGWRHRPQGRQDRPDRWIPGSLHAQVNPTGGSPGGPPTLPPIGPSCAWRGYHYQSRGPGEHSQARAQNHGVNVQTLPTRRREQMPPPSIPTFPRDKAEKSPFQQHEVSYNPRTAARASAAPRRSPRATSDMKKAPPQERLFKNAEPPPVDRTEGGRCAPGGTRTPNLLNRNQMLYPLSYGRLPFGWV